MERKEYPKFKAAAVQAAPIFLNLDATVEKCCDLIKEAADNGAKLIVFPEGFVSGFCAWIHFVKSFEDRERLHLLTLEQGVEIPSPAVKKLADACKKNGIYACVGVNEVENYSTCYITQLWFDPCGNLMGKHRKNSHTNVERAVYGVGDGSTYNVFDTELGKMGGLQCYEHMAPQNVAIMRSLGEQVHAASWPSVKNPSVSPQEGNCVNFSPIYYALATQTFVISSNSFFNEEMFDVCGIDKDYELAKMSLEAGGEPAMIVNPVGQIISKPLPRKTEGLVYGDIDLSLCLPAKLWLDTTGSFAPKGVQVLVDAHDRTPVMHFGKGKTGGMGYDDIVAATEEL